MVFNVLTGVERIDIDRVNVYPNPATAYINVEGMVDNLVLYDINGRVVAETTARTLDVSTLSPGNYLLQISNAEEVRTVKVLIVR